jgi:hypothetical protein
MISTSQNPRQGFVEAKADLTASWLVRRDGTDGASRLDTTSRQCRIRSGFGLECFCAAAPIEWAVAPVIRCRRPWLKSPVQNYKEICQMRGAVEMTGQQQPAPPPPSRDDRRIETPRLPRN